MARQWTGTPYQGADGIFHYPWTDPVTGESGEELSYEGPTQGSQAQPVAPTAPDWSQQSPVPIQSAPGSTYLYPGTPSPSWWNAPTNPWSIGAGTSEQGYGWGVPGFGQDPIKILTEYLPYLQQQATGQRGGYIPGSGTFNQWNLSQPGLIGTVGGAPNMNLRYGQGGTGDPTTGREEQTPDAWVQGDRLFNWNGMMGQGDLQGLDFIANLFGRSDTPSGIGTPAFSAPKAYWDGLAQAIGQGKVQPTARGWQLLQEKGYSPQTIGGAAPQQAAGVGGAGGAGGAGGQGGVEGAYASIIAMQQAQVAAQIAFTEFQMRTGDEKLAMEKAQQAFMQKFQEVEQAFSQGVTEAGLLGQFKGQQTQQAQQQQWMQGFQQQQFAEQQRQNQAGNALNLLQQQSALQGPADWLRYQQLNANTPQGLKDMLAGFAGRFNFAGSSAQGTPGPATLQSRTQDLLSGGQQGTGGAGQEGQSQFALPSPNQMNLQSWQNANPSQQQMLLGAYGAQGYDINDVQKQLAAAAPRYTYGGGGQAQLGL